MQPAETTAYDDYPIPPFDLNIYDAISAYCSVRPHNIPPELLAYIMTFVRDKDIPRCTYVNSAFYLAAKPHMFRSVALDQYFCARGPEHPLLDIDVPATEWARARPLFRRKWMTRVCHTLSVDVHHESYCACALGKGGLEPDISAEAMEVDTIPAPDPTTTLPLIPPLPHLRTLHLPFDVHGTLLAAQPPTPCALHALSPANFVHQNVFWTSRQPATTTIHVRESYTANIAQDVMYTSDTRQLLLQLPPLAPGTRITLVGPQTDGLHRAPRECAAFRDPLELRRLDAVPGYLRAMLYGDMCRASQCPHYVLAKVAREVARHVDGPRIRLVRFDSLCGDRTPPIYRHIGWLTRALIDAKIEDATLAGREADAKAWRARQGPVDPFHLISSLWWFRQRVGLKTLDQNEHLTDMWQAFGWPRNVSRLARDGGRPEEGRYGQQVKGFGYVNDEYWTPEPEREWVFVDDA